MALDQTIVRRWAWLTAGIAVAAAAPLLAASLNAQGGGPGSVAVWALGVALAWTAGGLIITRLVPADTPAETARRSRRTVVLVGLVLAGSSLIGGVVLASLPLTAQWVAGPVSAGQDGRAGVLGAALLAGAAEEVFFRGALPRLFSGRARWVVPTTLYAAVTLFTGSTALVAMALILGPVAMWAREVTRSLVAPLFIHALWTVTMVGLLPVLLGLLA